MPLIKSGTKAAIGKNIEREIAAGKPRQQSVAIALSVARKANPQALAAALMKKK